MSTVTVTISDTDDHGVTLEGKIDDPNAINEPPTAALIIGSYLAANAKQIVADAAVWFRQQVASQGQTQ